MAEKVLKSLTFNFENVSGARVQADLIDTFVIEDITKEMCMYSSDRACHERQICKYFVIMLFNGANYNVEYYPDYFNEEKKKLFDRIQQRKDICSITFEYEGGFSEEIWMNWHGTDEENKLQKTYWKNGFFVVEIGQEQERYEQLF